MSRPYVMTEAGLVPDTVAELYVFKDSLPNGRDHWRLIWARPGADSFVDAFGACSAPIFRTMREAVAYGVKHFQAPVSKWTFGAVFEPRK